MMRNDLKETPTQFFGFYFVKIWHPRDVFRFKVQDSDIGVNDFIVFQILYNQTLCHGLYFTNKIEQGIFRVSSSTVRPNR